MATSGAVALSSSLSAANRPGGPRLRSPGRLANGRWYGGNRAIGINLHVNTPSSVTPGQPRSRRAIQSIQISCSSGKDRKFQACRASPKAVSGDSQQAFLDPNPYKNVVIGDKWREIQGEKNWEGSILDPLDDGLRSELIRYGEFDQATYDSFDYDEYSKYTGTCKFLKKDFFKGVCLEDIGYEMFEYVYSTTSLKLPKFLQAYVKTSKVPDNEKWSKASNWAGYVAVSSDEETIRLGRRDIVIAWRGTGTNLEWIEDAEVEKVPAGTPLGTKMKPSTSGGAGEVKVESGFLSLYESHNEDSTHNRASARDQVLSALHRLITKYKDEEISITVTGHSLGASLALICAHDIGEWLELAISTPDSPPSDNHVWVMEKSTLPDPEYSGVRAAPIQVTRGRPMITTFTYGTPQTGNRAFKIRLEQLVKVFQVWNVYDRIPWLPPSLLFVNFKFLRWIVPWVRKLVPQNVITWFRQAFENAFANSYTQPGVKLHTDNLKSPHLKRSLETGNCHNLEVYLHLLTGLTGKNSLDFSEDLFTKHRRDPALVNKSSDMIQDSYLVPPLWYQEKNKGLVRIGGNYTYAPVMHEDFPEQSFQQGPFFPETALKHASESKTNAVGEDKSSPSGGNGSIGTLPASG